MVTIDNDISLRSPMEMRDIDVPHVDLLDCCRQFGNHFSKLMSGGGAIDLDWGSLTPELAERVVELLNHALVNTARPSFIGPVHVTTFEFGSTPPDVELVDVRDIYKDFLEDDEEELAPIEPSSHPEDDFEWVSRRDGVRAAASEGPLGSPFNYARPQMAQHRGGGSVVSDVGLSEEQRARLRNLWHGIRTPGLAASLPALSRNNTGFFQSPLIRPPGSGGAALQTPPTGDVPVADPGVLSSPPFSQSLPPELPPASVSDHPELQVHFRVGFESNLRITLETSLQINYPSPLIMALPIKITVTGLLFDGEFAVAYEGSRRRIHMCILDDQDPFSPIPAASHSAEINHADEDDASPRRGTAGTPQATKPSSIGVRLLPSIFIESEIGQADKHVLLNVSRVERFIQDVIRKTVEDELVFPNFQTVVLGDAAM